MANKWWEKFKAYQNFWSHSGMVDYPLQQKYRATGAELPGVANLPFEKEGSRLDGPAWPSLCLGWLGLYACNTQVILR